MTKDEIIQYWVNTSNEDFNTMLHLYESKDFHWSLFIGHLVIEKLLKALYVKNKSIEVPRTHDLLKISEKINIELDEKRKDLLDLLTTFNISARYPDYKQSFYKKCNQSFTTDNINKIKELRLWLLSLL